MPRHKIYEFFIGIMPVLICIAMVQWLPVKHDRLVDMLCCMIEQKVGVVDVYNSSCRMVGKEYP